MREENEMRIQITVRYADLLCAFMPHIPVDGTPGTLNPNQLSESLGKSQIVLEQALSMFCNLGILRLVGRYEYVRGNVKLIEVRKTTISSKAHISLDLNELIPVEIPAPVAVRALGSANHKRNVRGSL